MAEENKRCQVLATMPKNAPGYAATERDFTLERIHEQKVVWMIFVFDSYNINHSCTKRNNTGDPKIGE
jgi:hypothetical protein